MTFEVDHVFVCTQVGAPEADALTMFGLCEGRFSRHRGQGTASRHFFFRNAALELIWVENDEDARSPATRRTRLFERWHRRTSGACPFGICVRPTGSGDTLPFDAWEYAPSYLPKPWSIHIAANSENLSEPMLFHIKGRVRPEAFAEGHRQGLEHAAGFREITRLQWIRSDDGALSPELRAVVESGVLEIGSGSSQLLEVGFDDEPRGKSATFVPALPLSFFW